MVRSLAWFGSAAAGISCVLSSLAFVHHPRSSEHAAEGAAPAAQGTSSISQPALATRASAASTTESAFARLPLIRFRNENIQREASVRLYDTSGHVDEQEAGRLDELLCDTRDPKAYASLTLDRRTLQLAVKAALHFRVAEVAVVSAYRKPGRHREGLHATGKAIDFKLPGVPPRALAAYLRTLPRVGVGVYTHPRTSYVHLDDREHSFHWLDTSPPGRSYRELSIGNASIPKRDAAYVRNDDWPEGMTGPEDRAK